MTKLRRAPKPALNAVRAGRVVHLTEHGAKIGAIVPVSPAPMSGRELAARMRRHLDKADALAALAEGMKGLR